MAFAWIGLSDAGAAALLQCTIVDAASGSPIPARCRITDQYGINLYPPRETSFYHMAGGGYFYTGGSFSCTVPVRLIIIRVAHGFAYREAVDSMNVRADTSIVVALERIVSMESLGWYSGDTHVHINHAGGDYALSPEDALLMASAEGLNMVNCLDDEYYFTGTSASCSTAECIVFMSEEMRSACFGHLDLLGIRALISPSWATWWPMAMDVADSVHAQQGPVVVSAHPVPSDDFMQIEAWPGSGIARELPVDCIAHRVDAMDVLSYSNCHNGGIELDLWYRLLNCGFRIPPSAGTDAAMNRFNSSPLGGFRTFVRIADDGLSASGWFDALAAGRTFVTNGPLITGFEVGGHASGDSMNVAQPGDVVPVEISVTSVHPFNRIEVVKNGVPAVTVDLPSPRGSLDTIIPLELSESSWVSARVSGAKPPWIPAGNSLFAHTSPVYVKVGGRRILERTDAQFFVSWVADLELLAQTKGQWSDPLQSSRVFQELASARSYFEELALDNVAGVDGAAMEMPSAFRLDNLPNPFGGSTVITFDVPAPPGRSAAGLSGDGPESSMRLAIYDISGRLLRRLVEEPLAAGSRRVVWDGRDEAGRSVSAGIYFARFYAGGRVACRKMVRVR